MPSNFPRPTPFIISEAVTSGLKIPAIQIDPWLNFVRGAYIFASDIDKLSMGFKSWRKPLLEARDTVVVPSIIQNFNQEGRPKWKPLTARTIKNRLYTGFPRGPILQRTRRLEKAATRKNIWEVTSGVGREGVDMLRLRTEYFDGLVPYAYFHQVGAGVRQGRRFGQIAGFIGPSGKFLQFPGIKIGSGFNIESVPARAELGEETRTFRLPARPFIQMTIQEEAEIYTIFYNFMSKQVEKFWGPDVEGLGMT